MPEAPIDQYSIRVEWSEEDDCFIATSPEFPGFSAFGSSRSEALSEAETALRLRVDVMEDEGEELPEPNQVNHYSGQTRLRMPKWLHKQLAEEAERQDVSLNSLLVSYLAKQLGRDEVESLVVNMFDEFTKSMSRKLPKVRGAGNTTILASGEQHSHQDPLNVLSVTYS